MRQSIALAPIPPGPWEAAGAPGIELLALNRDTDSGARTALIRSVARPGIEHKAQYHHCEEEFLCLDGRFTFDGVHWMRPLSYACYPPEVVHGARVSVPGGYLLYLRTSGPTRAHAVPQPSSDEAYALPGACVTEPAVVLETPLPARPQAGGTAADAGRVRRRVLRTRSEPGAAVTLWEFGEGVRDIFGHFPSATSLEVLLFRAGVPASPHAGCAAFAYGCYAAGAARPTSDATGPVFALVHSGPWT